jgi:hypothetical protein
MTTIVRDRYTLRHDPATGTLSIETGAGKRMAIAVQAAVNRPEAVDAGTAWTLAGRTTSARGERLMFNAARTVWNAKRLVVEAGADGIDVRVEVEGAGAIERVVIGAGFAASVPLQARSTLGHLTWAKRVWSRSWTGSPIAHKKVMNPQPNGFFEQEVAATISQRITSATTFGPEQFNTFFAPPLYAYVLDDAWCLGICAPPGQNRYHHFDYTVADGWGVELHYDGRTQVEGAWSSPTLRIAPCAGAEAGLAEYVGHLRATGCAPRQGNRTPDWARRPMLCGWGQQTVWTQIHESGAMPPIGSPVTSGASGYASQKAYGDIVAQAEAAGLPFGVLTIDAGWSACATIPLPDARLWSDLKGFIASEHAKGRRVLLWLGTWNPGGLEEALRMPHAPGVQDACDPTHPEFRRRLVEAITHCIAPSGLDADGFKLDYTGDLVRGAAYQPAAPGLWGMELMRDYVGLIHGAMRAAKADTVLETHCGNPYFADVSDYLRLNDIFTTDPDVRPMMDFRARMGRIANPFCALDTDNDPFISRDAWLEYMRHQPKIGVPSLYTLTHMSFPGADRKLEAVQAGDLAVVAQIWREYLEKEGLAPLGARAAGRGPSH